MHELNGGSSLLLRRRMIPRAPQTSRELSLREQGSVPLSTSREVQFNPDQKRGQRDVENAAEKNNEPKRLQAINNQVGKHGFPDG